jgi:hypothetical protein
MATAVEPVARFSPHKRHVNDLMNDSLRAHVDSESIAFFCECPRTWCFDTVWLTPSDYESGRRHSGWYVRSPGP